MFGVILNFDASLSFGCMPPILKISGIAIQCVDVKDLRVWHSLACVVG